MHGWTALCEAFLVGCRCSRDSRSFLLQPAGSAGGWPMSAGASGYPGRAPSLARLHGSSPSPWITRAGPPPPARMRRMPGQECDDSPAHHKAELPGAPEHVAPLPPRRFGRGRPVLGRAVPPRDRTQQCGVKVARARTQQTYVKP